MTEMDDLLALVEKGEITIKEYNARRRALQQQQAAAAAPPPAPTPPAPTPPAPAAAAAPEAPPAPAGWGGDRGTKTWSADARTDDPNVRQVYAPTGRGIGDGRSALFLFGFRRTARTDQDMMAREIEHIADDIEVLRAVGYTVVVDPQATKSEFLAAVGGKADGANGLAPALLYWSAHGHADGGIDCCDGAVVRPQDLEGIAIAPGLRVAILAACYVGAYSVTWKKALADRPLVVGWGRPVTIDRAVEFLEHNEETQTDLDDLIRRYLVTDAPLPGEASNAYSPLVRAKGRIADLPQRIVSVATMLGARWRELEGCVELDVRVGPTSSRFVRVFVVDSAQPYNEGEPLLAVESDIGDITSLVDPTMLLAGMSEPGFARVALVKGEKEMPTAVAQGFLPIARVRDTDLAALVFQVARTADTLVLRIFGQIR